MLINITGGPDLTLHEVNEAATLIQEEADDDANIIFGAVIDESMGDEIRITVIATGFGEPVGMRVGPRPGTERHPAPPVVDNRPVKRHGLLVDDELDTPTWHRRRQEPPVPAPERAGGRRAAEESEDNLDIPAFLRRGVE